MKFLVLFSVLALCAINVNGLFHKHLKGGASADSSASASASASASSSGGHLAGIGNILAIPLNIKKQLLLAKQKAINKKFDLITGHLNKASSKFSSSSSASASANAGAEVAVNTGATYDNAEFSNGIASESASGLSVGGHYDNYQQQQEIHNYHPQPQISQPAVQNYHPQPAIHNYHPQPAAQTQYHETPVTVELYQIQQQPQQQIAPAPIAPAPIVPHQTYGPPEPIQNEYLPPHTHQPGCAHRRI